MTTVTAEKAIELLERAVEAKGANYVDPGATSTGCTYADDQGQPRCIVGHVLSYLSVDLRPVEVEGAYSHYTNLWGEDFSAGELHLGDEGKAPLGDVVFTIKAARVLEAAQARQDHGHTWSDALKTAREAA